MRLSPTILPGAIHTGAQRPVLRFEMPLADGIPDDQHCFFQREWLFDEVERAGLDRLHGGLDVPVPGDHHHLRIHFHLPQPPERGEPVEPRQPHVEDNDIEHLADDAIEALLAAFDRVDRVPLIAQHAAER